MKHLYNDVTRTCTHSHRLHAREWFECGAV